MEIDDFRSVGEVVHEDAEHGPLIFKDNGAKVLAVGHLDWVMNSEPKQTGRWYVGCPQLDDRLGVAVILDLLPSLGIHADILLTDSEELGCSTAEHFVAPKEYNWIFEFDRAGMDTVMYKYHTAELASLLESYHFLVGRGSFTDICELDHLGVAGFNFGTGYHGQHTMACWADIRETLIMAHKFRRFYTDCKDKRFTYVKPPKPKFVRYPKMGFNTLPYRTPASYTSTPVKPVKKKDESNLARARAVYIPGRTDAELMFEFEADPDCIKDWSLAEMQTLIAELYNMGDYDADMIDLLRACRGTDVQLEYPEPDEEDLICMIDQRESAVEVGEIDNVACHSVYCREYYPGDEYTCPHCFAENLNRFSSLHSVDDADLETE
tara:strand:- start:164 stop:1300 length:1137 start_codon:yes stop_codon:yes gene_type:complete